MDKKKIINELIIIFWVFIIGSVVGYIFEMIVVLFQKHYFETRQGLIYGPLIPVYGIGAVMYYVILNNIKIKDKLKVFLVTAILRRSNRIYMLLCSRKSIWNNFMGLFSFNI